MICVPSTVCDVVRNGCTLSVSRIERFRSAHAFFNPCCVSVCNVEIYILGFRVQGLGFGVWGLGIRVFGVSGLRFRVSGFGFRV